MDKHWRIPKKGYEKLNVNGYYTQNPLWNANKSGLGCVIRDDKGKILKMVTGTQPGLTEKRNQLLAWVLGQRECYFDKHEMVILETDNLYAFEAWQNFKKGIVAVDEKKEVEALGKRCDDPNLKLEVRLVPPYCNKFVMYLARNGGDTREEVIVTDMPFGSVMAIWYDDLGLAFPWIRLVKQEDGARDDAPKPAASGMEEFNPIEDQAVSKP